MLVVFVALRRSRSTYMCAIMKRCSWLKSCSITLLCVHRTLAVNSMLNIYCTEHMQRCMHSLYMHARTRSRYLLHDMSAAFDTVDHEILLNRLEQRFGMSDPALMWMRSYLSDRSQSVNAPGGASSNSSVACGVHQGSVLGLFYSLRTQLQLVISSDDKT